MQNKLDGFFQAILKFKNVCLNFSDFTEMVNHHPDFEVETSRENLKKGLYGTMLNGTKVWVNKIVPVGKISFSNSPVENMPDRQWDSGTFDLYIESDNSITKKC